MSEIILANLRNKLSEISSGQSVDVETERNVLKEELQFYVLNFIYHHPEYGKWIMYGGSALRICHGLDRMSVDLDFEVPEKVTDTFLETLKNEILSYFSNSFAASDDFLSIKITSERGLTLKFHIGETLGIGHPSKQIYVKIDLNHFTAPKTVTERIPINRGQLSFVIITYNMSSLMASKIAAIFTRGTRGVGEALYEEKGRDIYDLLWYMGKAAVPDLDYLIAKKIDVTDLRSLFDKLTLKMNKVSDANLKQDLSPLFLNRNFIEDWLANWRESYLYLLGKYKIRTVMGLERVKVFEDLLNDRFYFSFLYQTDDDVQILIKFILSDYWVIFNDMVITEREIDKHLDNKIEFTSNGTSHPPASQEKLLRYADLFYKKTEAYFKKTNRTMFGDSITTKIIRATADNFNSKEEIVLTKSVLLSCELDDMLK
ncbi:MAG: nucleotidyl transferase AbiEii/AbiGii toxin family protein [Candidatus Parcubacteria bacterium]|nr:nucleotidyl transferase AbiEii/AbiGii toxin family protein [Candidatus Parcubacteria bacterium]